MVVEELVSVLGLEIGSDVAGVLEEFHHAIHSSLGAIAGIGGIAAAAFGEIVHSAAEAGVEIAVTSQKLGVASDVLQELKYAADQSDVSFESLTTGLKFLSKNAAEAAEGGEEASKAFQGIALRDGNGKLKTADQLLMTIAADFENVKDPIKQTELAMKRFGRSGIDLVPLLKKGSSGIKEFMEEAHDLGLVMDEETLEASENFNHGLKRVTGSLIGLRNIVAAPFIQGFADGLNEVSHIIRDLQPFIKRVAAAIKDAWQRFKDVIDIVDQLALKVKKAIGEGGVIGSILGAVDAMQIFEAVVVGLGVVLGVVALEAAADWLIALAPFIAIAAVIGFIVDDIATWMDGGDSLIGMLVPGFDEIKEGAIGVYDAVVDFFDLLKDPDAWKEFVSEATQAFLDFIPVALLAAAEFFVALTDPENWAKVGMALLGLEMKITGFLAGIASTILGAINTLVIATLSGIMDGISKKFPMLASFAKGAGSVFSAVTGAQVGEVANAVNPIAAAKNFADTITGSGGAASPSASAMQGTGPGMGGAQVIHLSRNAVFNIDATNMTPDQLKATMREHEDDMNRATDSSVPLMSGG